MDDFLKEIDKGIDEAKVESYESKNKKETINERWEKKQIDEEFHEKYLKLFREGIDKEKNGIIDKNRAFNLFHKANSLTSSDVLIIFDLADLDQDSHLNAEEFVLAMYLIQNRLDGEEFPSKIPDNLARRNYIPLPKAPQIQRNERDGRKVGRNLGGGPSYKICILGEQCGKSTFIDAFLYGQSERDFDTLEYQISFNYSLNDRNYYLTLFDTPSSDTYLETMHTTWFAGTNGFLLFYNITSKNTFVVLKTYREYMMKYFKDDRIPVVVVGTHADLEEKRQVAFLEGQNWARLYKFGFVECSSETLANIDQPVQMILERIEKNLDKGLNLSQQHVWKKVLFSVPTSCSKCNTLIWSVLPSHGYYCEVCNKVSHKSCLSLISRNCDPHTKSESKRIPSDYLKKKESKLDVVSLVSNEELIPVLTNNEARLEFELYLQTKKSLGYSHLNLWCQIREYKNLREVIEKKRIALAIYERFFEGTLASELGIDKVSQNLKEYIETNISRADDILNHCQQIALKVLHDVYFPDYVSAKFSTEFNSE